MGKKIVLISLLSVFISYLFVGNCSAAEPFEIGQVLSKTIVLIYSDDWDFKNERVVDEFSKHEIKILSANKKLLECIIISALENNHSIWGARIAGYFKLENCLSGIRDRFFEPGRCYLWEGPDYSKEKSYLLNEQYRYHYPYLKSIEQLTGRPIDKAVEPDKDELALIVHLSRSSAETSGHYWAKWMIEKLKINTND